MRVAVFGALLFACRASQPVSSVTLATPSSSTSPPIASVCPRDVSRAAMAKCTEGQICRYPDVACVCRMVPYCPGGAVREGPPPPAESLELECMNPDCVDAVAGARCAHPDVQCRGPACYSRLTCTHEHWTLVDLGPPP